MSDLANAVERLVVELGVAFQQVVVYAPGHPQIGRGIERALAAHAAVLERSELPETTLLIVEQSLVVDRRPIPEEATWSRGLLLGMKRSGITGLTLARGLAFAELADFLSRAPAETPPASSPHILVGRAGFSGAPEPGSAVSGLPPAGRAVLSQEDVAGAREDLMELARGAARTDRLRGVVATLARSLSNVKSAALRLSAATVEERSLVHGLGTAIGTIRLAQALGLDEERVQNLGLAALLHDIGRLPSDRDSGPVPLRLHPVVGAGRLAAAEDLPDIVPLVAFEHHLRHDGLPNYPSFPDSRIPSPAAQIVSVADTWDTLRDRGAASVEDSLVVLRERAGTYLNPHLVELFAAITAPT